MYFDRFDICEAYAALECDFNVGGILYKRGKQVAAQLHRIGFRLGAASHGDYESLSENGKAIYNNYLRKSAPSTFSVFTGYLVVGASSVEDILRRTDGSTK